MHRLLMIAVISMIVVSGFLIVVQIWYPVVSMDVFIKLLMTFGIFTLIAGLVLVLRSDLQQHKRLKDENYLD